MEVIIYNYEIVYDPVVLTGLYTLKYHLGSIHFPVVELAADQLSTSVQSILSKLHWRYVVFAELFVRV